MENEQREYTPKDENVWTEVVVLSFGKKVEPIFVDAAFAFVLFVSFMDWITKVYGVNFMAS